MPVPITGYRVFIASPGGLQSERKHFRKIIEEFNEQSAILRSVMFIPTGWEDTLGGVGRPQEIINDELRTCDYFLMVLWDRWGMSPDLPGRSSFTSGTEEEFHVAEQCFGDQKSPMRQLVILFKAVDSRQLSDPGEELKKVISFQKDLEAEKRYLYQRFDDLDKFADLLRRFLSQWLLDHEQGKTKKKTNVKDVSASLGEHAGSTESPLIVDVSPVPTLVAEAQKLAKQGMFTEAESAFAKAVETGNDPQALLAYGTFLAERGSLSQAESMFNRVIAASDKGREKWTGVAYIQLGHLNSRRNRPTEAEQALQRALHISKILDLPIVRADALVSLGRLRMQNRELNEAESFFTEASSIYRRLDHRRGSAQVLSNLAELNRLRGSLDQAKQYLQEALIIFKGLQDENGVANALNNIGLVYIALEDFASAENSIRESLTANTKQRRLESVALNHANLGDIHDRRREYREALNEFQMAIDLYKSLGILHRIDVIQRRIDIVRERMQASAHPAKPGRA